MLMCLGRLIIPQILHHSPSHSGIICPGLCWRLVIFVMQKIGYRLNIREGQCTRFNLTESFRPIEVPPEATFFGSFYVGSSAAEGAGVLVNAWGGQTERGKQQVPDYYVATFTNPVSICLPFL